MKFIDNYIEENLLLDSHLYDSFGDSDFYYTESNDDINEDIESIFCNSQITIEID